MTNGIYETGNKGRQPEWSTVGNFRWKLSIDAIDRALKYISDHSTTKDAILKLQTIFKLLLQNETRLCGTVYIGGSTPNLCNETCDLIKYLRGERRFLWDGKWLFTESGELVSPKMVSKHDICQAFYGQVNPTSTIYELLGFKKSEEDEIDELKKQVSQKQLDALFEDELRRRFGITSHDLEGRFPHNSGDSENAEEHFEFPVARIKNWEALRKHAAEMMVYAAPVKYEYKIRLLRVSNHPKETKAYLHNMYRYVGTYKYACQMCHDVCSSIASIELFLKPEAELDPIHLYLTAIVNAENARQNNHDNEASATFEQNRIWALNRLKEIFHDEDNNLERWLKGECCIFRMNHSEQPMSVNIGKDIEALYNFLCFCYKLNTNQRISDEYRDYLALSITRSCSDCWEEC